MQGNTPFVRQAFIELERIQDCGHFRPLFFDGRNSAVVFF